MVLPTDEGDTLETFHVVEECAVAVEELAADAVEGLASNGLRTVHEKLPRKGTLDPSPCPP
jgi:hypothetical protein